MNSNQAISILIQAAEKANQKGDFTLSESSQIHMAVMTLKSPPVEKTQTEKPEADKPES